MLKNKDFLRQGKRKELLVQNILGNKSNLNRKEVFSFAGANWLEDIVLLLRLTEFQN